MTQAEAFDKKFAQLQTVVNALDWARKHDLDLEWLDSFLENRSQGYNIPDSIQHANREWDL